MLLIQRHRLWLLQLFCHLDFLRPPGGAVSQVNWILQSATSTTFFSIQHLPAQCFSRLDESSPSSIPSKDLSHSQVEASKLPHRPRPSEVESVIKAKKIETQLSLRKPTPAISNMAIKTLPAQSFSLPMTPEEILSRARRTLSLYLPVTHPLVNRFDSETGILHPAKPSSLPRAPTPTLPKPQRRPRLHRKDMKDPDYVIERARLIRMWNSEWEREEDWELWMACEPKMSMLKRKYRLVEVQRDENGSAGDRLDRKRLKRLRRKSQTLQKIPPPLQDLSLPQNTPNNSAAPSMGPEAPKRDTLQQPYPALPLAPSPQIPTTPALKAVTAAEKPPGPSATLLPPPPQKSTTPNSPAIHHTKIHQSPPFLPATPTRPAPSQPKSTTTAPPRPQAPLNLSETTPIMATPLETQTTHLPTATPPPPSHPPQNPSIPITVIVSALPALPPATCPFIEEWATAATGNCTYLAPPTTEF